MSNLLNAYNALSPTSPRTDVSDVLNNIINGANLSCSRRYLSSFFPAPHFTFDRESRVELIKAILRDLQSCGPQGNLTLKGIVAFSLTQLYQLTFCRSFTGTFGD